MRRLGRWTVAVGVAVVVFGVCLWTARSVSFDWMPDEEANQWVVATAFATVVATVSAAAVGWWAGREEPSQTPGEPSRIPGEPSRTPEEPSAERGEPSPQRTVSQRATASGQGRSVQVAGNQYTLRTPPPASAGTRPGQVEQEAKASGNASVTQVGGDQYREPEDDE